MITRAMSARSACRSSEGLDLCQVKTMCLGCDFEKMSMAARQGRGQHGLRLEQLESYVFGRQLTAM